MVIYIFVFEIGLGLFCLFASVGLMLFAWGPPGSAVVRCVSDTADDNEAWRVKYPDTFLTPAFEDLLL